MSDSEKPLKITSFILSGLLIASALLYFFFGQGDPVEAEVVVEYSAPADFDPSELLAKLEALRADDEFLKEVAFRSGLGNESEPEFAEKVTRLSRSLAFETNFGESTITIRFTHRKSATALKAATTAATVAKEKLEQQREERARGILRQEDLVDDKRRLLEQILRVESLVADTPQKESAPRPRGARFVDPKGEYESALRRLAELKAEPVVSIGAIRASTLAGD